jgi:hypothetical protein
VCVLVEISVPIVPDGVCGTYYVTRVAPLSLHLMEVPKGKPTSKAKADLLALVFLLLLLLLFFWVLQTPTVVS